MQINIKPVTKSVTKSFVSRIIDVRRSATTEKTVENVKLWLKSCESIVNILFKLHAQVIQHQQDASIHAKRTEFAVTNARDCVLNHAIQ